VRPQRDTLTGFEADECVALTNRVMRIGVHIASGELISIFSRRTKREHLLVRLLKGDVPQPMGLTDAGAAPPRGTWRVARRTPSSVTLTAEHRRLRFTRTVRLLPNGMAEVRTTVEHRGTGRAEPVQLAFRAPLVPAGGGIHGHTTTSHFGHRLFIRTDSSLVEQGHRKYSNSRYEWAYPQWAAFVDTVRREGVAFLFNSVTPVISVDHGWNEMLVGFRSAWQTPTRRRPVEYVYRVCVFDGVGRVDRLDNSGLAAIDLPATIAPGERVEAHVGLIAFRRREGMAEVGWEGNGRAHRRDYRVRLLPYRTWRRRLRVGPFPDPIEVKYNEYAAKPARVWVSMGTWRAECWLADTPSITSAPVQAVRVSALTGRVRRSAQDLVDCARAEHEADRLPREGLAVCLAYQRFLEKRMREEAWTEQNRARAFRWLDAMRAVVDAGVDIASHGIIADPASMHGLLDDNATGDLLRSYADRAARMDRDVPLGPTKLRMTWGTDYFYPFRAARANAVAHAITGDEACLKRAKRDLLKIARNHLTYGSCLGESLFIATTMLGVLEAYDVVQPHLTLEEQTDLLDYLLWCTEILFDDVNLTGSNHDSWHAAALGWLACRFAYLPQARLWAERCAEILRHHIGYQLPDGAWTEQSPSYHDMNVRSFVLGAEALRGPGFDLYASEDGRSIQAMARWSIGMAGPERRYSALDDCRGGPPSLDTLLLVAAAYRDAEMLGYAHTLIEAGAAIAEPLALWRYPRDLEPADPAPLYASLLPASGHLIFRSTWMPPAARTGGQAAGGTGVRAILQFGPHGGWHGHADKLALDLMIDGRPVLTDAGVALYEDAVHWNWHHTTRAHNTVVVDGQSQRACTGRLLAHRDLKRTHLAVVAAETYPGVVHERAVLDIPGFCLVVLDRLRSNRPRRYDLIWHGAGEMTRAKSAAAFTLDHGPTVTIVVPGARLKAGTGPLFADETAPFVETSRRGRRVEFITVIAPLADLEDVNVTQPSGANGPIVIERAGRRIEVNTDRRHPSQRLTLR